MRVRQHAALAGVRAAAVITGAMGTHALGRWGERHDVEPEQAPRLVRWAAHAAIWLATEPRAEQSIALRITRHERADGRHSPSDADADAYLVGNLRRHPDEEKLMFTDFGAGSCRDWVSPELARFGDLLTGILRGEEPVPLPYVAPRASHVEEMKKTA